MYSNLHLNQNTTMMNLLIQYDFYLFLIIPAIIFILCMLGKEPELAFTMSFVFLLISTALGNIALAVLHGDRWETATLYKTVPASEIISIETPDSKIDLWVGKEKVYTITTIEEYRKKDQIDRIEYRKEELIGPDYNKMRLIFKDNSQIPMGTAKF